jgi:DNA processing protein
LGIDGAAHAGALQANVELQTVAVLGSGLDIIYPSSHTLLVDKILNSAGIVVSQFEPETPPYPSNFLNRNRIVSGLSKAVLVVEATLKSGSLVTARNALEQGKEVLVVPGDIYNPRFEGSNRLIQQGASLVTSVQDILDILGVSTISSSGEATVNQKLPFTLATTVEKKIIETLELRRELRIEELPRLLGTSSFDKELLTLELQGAIKRLPGNVLRLGNRR